jgi:hypothetical protein
MPFDSIKEKLVKYGITPSNAVKATPIFLGISFIWIGVLWSFCYIFSPSKVILSRLPLKYIRNAFDKQKSIDHPIIKYLPEKIRGRAGYSFCEMLAIKSLVAPITLPLKIWITIKLL